MTMQLRAFDSDKLSLMLCVRIQGGGGLRRPVCSSLALIGHNQGVGECVIAWDDHKRDSNDRFPVEVEDSLHFRHFGATFSYSITY